MQQLHLANDRVAVTVLPTFGARVSALTDVATGRNWLIDGPPVGSADADAVFGGAEACGWDECFPTVAPCEQAPDGRMMRDHGDLWGRPWQCRRDAQSIQSVFAGEGFRFVRELQLTDDGLAASYSVANTGAQTMPYLWSQHCLLATEPDERISIDGVGPMTVTGGWQAGTPVATGCFDWPELATGLPNLDRIRASSAQFAIKAYASALGRVSAGVTGCRGSISLSWNADEIPFIGLWLDYGGWPQEAPVHQIAIEPTTAPADHLAGALGQGRARLLSPDETHRWTIDISLTPATGQDGE